MELFILLSAVVGLAIGSFLNVVVHRVPAGLSIVAPPSRCPGCEQEIAWYDNIPVLSWLLLRGKCRHCGAPISPRYLIVEVLTAVAFALVTWWWWPQIEHSPDGGILAANCVLLAAWLFFAAVSIALAVIDMETHRLPNVIVLPAIVVSTVLLTVATILAGDWTLLRDAVIGGAALFAFYLIVALISPRGMGFGDVKLAGLVGLQLGWFGWQAVVMGGFAAFLIGGVVGIVLLLLGRATRKSGIPFGPYMLAGAWIGMVVGVDILTWYLTLMGVGPGQGL